MGSSGIGYRPEVDGLRALAVVPVILFHAGFELFRGGFVGVDVFFVISGYLITGILLSDLQQDRFSLVDFYERRARRILPALFLVLAACTPVAWGLLVPSEARSFSQSLASVAVFASNFFFWRSSGYFDTAAELKPLLHTWSLAVEEQYYLFFPLLLAGLWRRHRRWIGPALAGLAIASLLLAEWGRRVQPAAAFYLLPTRGWELLVGASVALWRMRRPAAPAAPWLAEGGGVLGLALLLLALFTFDKRTPFPGVYGLVPTLGTALVLLFAHRATRVGRLFGHRALVGVGLISYSAYLWHQPLLAFARNASEAEPAAPVLAGLVLATFALAYLSWRFVETPCRDRSRVSRRQIFAGAAAGTAACLLLALAGHLTAGFARQRLDAQAYATWQSAVHSPLRDACHTGGARYRPVQQACEYQQGQLSWAVFGDSHAVELAYGLAQALATRGEKLKHFSFSNCVPALTRDETGKFGHCARWTREALALIGATPSIRHVVVTYRIHYDLFGEHARRFPALPDDVDPAERARRWSDYVGVLDTLLGQGKQVTLVLQAPELPRAMERLLLSSARQGDRVVGVDRAWWDARSAYVREHLKDIPAQVRIVDPAGLLCDQHRCHAAGGGTAYYFDDDHLSVAGAAIVAAEVLRLSRP